MASSAGDGCEAGASSASSKESELETLVDASRNLRSRMQDGDEEGVDSVLKDMLRFVNQIKEDPDLLEPEAAADVITKEETMLTLASILNDYVIKHSSSSSSSTSEPTLTNGHPPIEGDKSKPNDHSVPTNGHLPTPNNLMRAVRVAQIVAEVAKIEVMRELCVECGCVDFCRLETRGFVLQLNEEDS